MLAAINAAAAEFSNDRMRKFWVALMTIGYPLGNILAALILSPLLKTHSWRVGFELGAGATAAMIPVVWFGVPESVSWLCRKQPANALAKINTTLRRMGRAAIDSLPPLSAAPPKAPLADVFKPQYLRLTLLLVFAYFAHITSFYYILKWAVTIVSELGYSPSAIADVLFWASVGGATGGAVLGLLALRTNLIWLTSGVLVLGMISIAVFGMEDEMSESPLAEGRVGELRIKGPSVMQGYWDDNERTRETFAGDYLKTGDLGFVHAGKVYICGRSKEVVIVNGRNYYPQDMEWEASKVSGVRKGNVVAFGARDPSGNERDRERVVLAFEVQAPEDLARSADISQAIRRPVHEGIGLTLDDVVALPSGTLPKTSSGKLQRAKTRTLYEAGELKAETKSRDVSKLDLV
jgi:acyl-CoA synthetase (AMP-forming)/AMP-acid ligase II